MFGPPVAVSAEPSVLQAAVLGIIQGLTEFLPVSSSAHLYVVPTLLGWGYQGLAFDVALHAGTLIALLAAYGSTWWTMARDAVSGGPAARADARQLWLQLAVASVPAAVAGKLLEDVADRSLRSLPLQAAMLALFGFVLWAVDRRAPAGRDAANPGWKTSLGVGLAQTLALVPGVSRSGITITAGRGLGLTRVAAARFSFLLATPITLGAVLLEARHLPRDAAWAPLVVGIVTSAFVGWIAIRGLISWLGRAGFGVFFAYRVALALTIVLVSWRR
jgi:undecaprenyl-diphosphatase